MAPAIVLQMIRPAGALPVISSCTNDATATVAAAAQHPGNFGPDAEYRITAPLAVEPSLFTHLGDHPGTGWMHDRSTRRS